MSKEGPSLDGPGTSGLHGTALADFAITVFITEDLVMLLPGSVIRELFTSRTEVAIVI